MRAKPEVSHEYSDDQYGTWLPPPCLFWAEAAGLTGHGCAGNVLSSLAMVIAIAVTLLNKEILTFERSLLLPSLVQ